MTEHKKYEKHGKSDTKLYGVWHGMIQRCENPNSKAAKNYCLKGISVCDEWKVFPNFYEWAMNNGYREGLTLDRKDSNKNYNPDNCRWVDRFVQNSNTSRNVYYTYNGKTMTISQWSRELGIARNTLLLRIRNHGYEKALSIKGNMRGRKIS